MKRSEFFKRLGIGVAAMAIVPMTVKSSEQEEQVLTVDDVEELLEKGVPVYQKRILLDRDLDLTKFSCAFVSSCIINGTNRYSIINGNNSVLIYNFIDSGK